MILSHEGSRQSSLTSFRIENILDSNDKLKNVTNQTLLQEHSERGEKDQPPKSTEISNNCRNYGKESSSAALNTGNTLNEYPYNYTTPFLGSFYPLPRSKSMFE